MLREHWSSIHELSFFNSCQQDHVVLVFVLANHDIARIQLHKWTKFSTVWRPRLKEGRSFIEHPCDTARKKHLQIFTRLKIYHLICCHPEYLTNPHATQQYTQAARLSLEPCSIAASAYTIPLWLRGRASRLVIKRSSVFEPELENSEFFSGERCVTSDRDREKDRFVNGFHSQFPNICDTPCNHKFIFMDSLW